MIDIQVRIHDKFSVEMKLGFYTSPDVKNEDFAVNTWLFVPNSLDINPLTYSKTQFYRDIKTNIRLITPVFKLEEITGQPLRFLENSMRELVKDPDKAGITDYEYQIKMFMSIFKSALRDDVMPILRSRKDEFDQLATQYLTAVGQITYAYRNLKNILDKAGATGQLYNFFQFGDEYMSNIVEARTFRLLRYLDNHLRKEKHREIRKSLVWLIDSETRYRSENGYISVKENDPSHNRHIVFRRGVLKKYIGSDLFLQARKKKDGLLVEQIYLSLAAGVSMIFATVIAFSFQQKYGNFTMPLFVALVVSYMLKDRIKELMRYYFAYKLGGKYFDNRTYISIKDRQMGWEKEGMDFITDDKVPRQVMEIRSRSPLLEAENRLTDEKIILFRKLVRIDQQVLRESNEYEVDGIHDIIRFHITRFIQKMDNPETPLYVLNADGTYKTIEGEKIYYLNFIVQLQHGEQSQYKRYRLVCTRNGIIDLELLK